MTRRSQHHGQGIVALMIVTILTALCACQSENSDDWQGLKAMIRQRFPEVQQLSTKDLHAWLQADDRPAPFLMDAREQAEFDVSHLQGAKRAESREEVIALSASLAQDRAIVVYCSVGFRSARVASGLGARGFTQVYNLEGSIFEWANAGYPVYRGPQEVKRVHPYDEDWGRFLDRTLWSTEAR